jgi:hypothetical protein
VRTNGELRRFTVIPLLRGPSRVITRRCPSREPSCRRGLLRLCVGGEHGLYIRTLECADSMAFELHARDLEGTGENRGRSRYRERCPGNRSLKGELMEELKRRTKPFRSLERAAPPLELPTALGVGSSR